MLIRYQDLVSLRLVATDGSEHAIEDVFVTDKDQRVTYVVADIGGWFDDRKAMVSIERFGEPDVAAARWPCNLDEAALEERPAPRSEVEPGQKTLPDAMLAPVGSRVSPRLLYGSAGDEAMPIPPKADPKHKAPEGATLHSVGEWILDTDVRASDGPAGKLMGLIFDSADWRARYIIVATGGDRLSRNQRVIETSHIADMDFYARTVTLTLPNEQVQKALDLHEVDDVEGKWYNKVLAYYGLQS
jgi:hypothetical protein